jgi:hypothetical protein
VEDAYGKIDLWVVDVAITKPTRGELDALIFTVPPSDTDEPPEARPEYVRLTLEFVRPELSRVPSIVGVKLSEPAAATIEFPNVRPLKEAVDVAKVIDVAVVVAHPEPSDVRYVPAAW